MKFYFCKNLSAPISLIIIFISLISFKGDLLNAEDLFEELELNNSTKINEDSSIIPTNPFQNVEMIRKYNSMNDATNPTDAIDDALESFYSLEED